MDNKYCGGVEVMEKSWVNWTAGGLSMSGDYSVVFIQKASKDFQYYWDYVVGTSLSEVTVGLFCACFLKKMLNLTCFTACLFFLILWLQSKKSSYFYGTGHIMYRYYLNYFLDIFFKIRLIDSIVVIKLLLFRFLIFYAIIWSQVLKMFEDKKMYFRT